MLFDSLRGKSLTWAIALCTAMAQLLFGYDQGVLGGLVGTDAFISAFGVCTHKLIPPDHLANQ
jgi:MFS family permease